MIEAEAELNLGWAGGDGRLPAPEASEESEVVECEAPGSVPSPDNVWRVNPEMAVDRGLIAELIEEGRELLEQKVSGGEA